MTVRTLINKLSAGSDLLHYNETYSKQDPQTVTFTHTTFLVNCLSHELINGNIITFSNSGGGLPTGLDNVTHYYVVNATTDTFQVSLSRGGAVVTFSDDGTGTSNFNVLVGSFSLLWVPLDVPDARRLSVRQPPADTGTLLTEVLLIANVTPGSTNFYCDFSTGTVTVAVAGTVYATYNGPNNPIVAESHTVPAATTTPINYHMCQFLLDEIPLEFNTASTDSRKIVIVTLPGPVTLTETKIFNTILTDASKYYVEFDTGRVSVHYSLAGVTIHATYYGTGSIILSDDVNYLHTEFVAIDVAAIESDGVTAMSADLDMNGHAITNFKLNGTVDGLKLPTHTHTGSALTGVVLFGNPLGSISGSCSFIDHSIVSDNLNNKTLPGEPGAVGTNNIQNNAVTHSELALDASSLSKVSYNILNIGGSTGTTLGIGCVPDPASTAEIEFKSTPGVSKDKIIFHDISTLLPPVTNTCGISIDGVGNMNLFTVSGTRFSFRSTSASGTEVASIDTGAHTLYAYRHVSTLNGKMQENGHPIFPTGFTTAFYQPSAPGGWSLIKLIPGVSPAASINNYVLRLVSSGGGVRSPGTTANLFTGWMSGHTHTFSHSHMFNGSTYAPSHSMTSHTDVCTGNGHGYGTADEYNSNHHTHSMSFSFPYNGEVSSAASVFCKYVDVIFACKN